MTMSIEILAQRASGGVVSTLDSNAGDRPDYTPAQTIPRDIE
jgi:hypothetical protein